MFNYKIFLMRNSNISLFYIIINIFIALFIYSCANPQPPSGGPPDTTPPEIIEIFPENQTINFKEKNILMKFSKYMDKSKVIENFTISPNVPLEFDWSGKELEITLPENLDTSVTYSITLGTEYSDLYQNKPETSFSFSFSAGSKIDSGFIAGKVIDLKPSGAYIFAYNIDKINPDTLNPSTTKPDYKVQLGSSSEFKIPALKDANYRIFAIRDEFRNELYDINDAYSSSVQDIRVVNSFSEKTILKLGPVKDVSGPELNEAESKYSNLISIKFNEILNPEFIYPESFQIESEDNSKVVKVISAGLHYENKSRIDVVTEENLDTNLVWIIRVIPSNSLSVRDTLGNLVNDSLNFAKFKPNNLLDTNRIQMMFTSVKDSSEYIPTINQFEFIFDKSINVSSGEINLLIYSDDINQAIKSTVKLSGSTISITPDTALKDNKWHKIMAEFKGVKSFTNQALFDTTFTINFKTLDYKVKGSVSGIVQFEQEFCEFNKYLILNHLNGKDKYICKLNNNSEWFFKNIETGEYTAELFCDVDGNGEYSYGEPFPYKFSEPFVVFEDILKIKPRWVLENIILKIKK